MKTNLIYRIAAALLITTITTPPLFAVYSTTETFENKTVSKITLIMKTPDAPFDATSIKSRMGTKEGDPFDQVTFDNDLKMLSEDYDRIEPNIEVRGGQVSITVKVWQKPIIKKIEWTGNKKIKTSTLKKELGIKPGEVFDRDSFNKAFMKVKELYVKKGYFEARGSYTITPSSVGSGIDIEITIHEGRSGRIGSLQFKGFSKKEQSEILSMMVTKKYNFFASWLTGTGVYRSDMVDHDKLIIVNYLQNKGYADAQVQIELEEDPADPSRLIVLICAEREEKFHFGNVTFSGNHLYTDSQVEDIMTIKPESVYSPEDLRQTVQNIKDLYGQRGYIETNVTYQLSLNANEPIYNVHFDIEEGEQYRVGLIRVLGNVSTETRVILHQNTLVPGETFNSNQLKATEYRLLSTGYFKSVNVYPVKSQYDSELGPNYRDVVIEVEETTTGNVSLFFGASSVDNVFGGLDLSENNFNHKGLTSFWKGLSNLRGGGEMASAKIQIGKKSTQYTINWMDPHFKDSNWRIGFEANYTHSTTVSDNFDIDTGGGTIFASYPFSANWTGTMKMRARNAVVEVSNDIPKVKPKENQTPEQIQIEQDKVTSAWKDEKERQERNSGIVLGLGGSLVYDSTDRPYKPRMGFRSLIEGEMCGVRRHSSDDRYFPFAKFAYLNTFYWPIGTRGTFKSRFDFRYLQTFGMGTPDLLPMPERYMMGGENSVRGYEQFSIGPTFPGEESEGTKSSKDDIDPLGGATSTLLSVEYLHTVLPPFLDLFVFVDGGAASIVEGHIGRMQYSVGGGARVEIANRMPFIFGYGYPINPKKRKVQQQGFFFSMGAQF
ncbi:MAG: outer membrane protein assembly factor BamA [Chlamydiales bacterium]|nr:outer membrane protein assembly factor BamA [Chlamydiales bacterium]